MEFLPVQWALNGRRVVLVGGGEVAARKAELVARAGAVIEIVAPALAASLTALVEAGGAHHVGRGFEPADVENAALVIAATDDPAVNRAVFEAATTARVPVNVVDQPALSTVLMSSIVERGPLTVAVSTGGLAPALARLIRARIEAGLPERLGDLVAWAGPARDEIGRLLPDPRDRHRFWQALLDSDWEAAFAAGTAPDPAALVATFDRSHGRLHLVRLAVPDFDLVTLGTVRLLQQADLILAEPAIPASILDLGRRDAVLRRIATIDEAAEAAAETIAAGGLAVAIGLI